MESKANDAHLGSSDLTAESLAEVVKPAPLTDEQIAALVPNEQDGWTRQQYCQWMARAVERAHGIDARGVDVLAEPSMKERIAAALECLEDNDNHGATVILKTALGVQGTVK